MSNTVHYIIIFYLIHFWLMLFLLCRARPLKYYDRQTCLDQVYSDSVS